MSFSRPTGPSRSYQRLLSRLDALAPSTAWVLGTATGAVIFGAVMMKHPTGVWAVLLLPLVAVALSRRAGLRPGRERRGPGGLITVIATGVVLGVFVLMVGQMLATVIPTTPAKSSLNNKVQPLPEGAPSIASEPDTRPDDSGSTSGSTTTESSGNDWATTDSTVILSNAEATSATGEISGNDINESGQDTRSQPSPTTPPSPSCSGGMALIEGGEWEAVNGKPKSVEAFCIDVTEVTASDYRRCLEASKCKSGGLEAVYRGKVIPECNLVDSEREGLDHHPINCVNFSQAQRYCRGQNKRLPSEREWEWAARSRDRGTTYPWGDGSPPGCRVTVMDGCTRGSTSPVKTKLRDMTHEGVRDMGGNVREWVMSSNGRPVVRGGGWKTTSEESRFRTTHQGQSKTRNYSEVDLGFRCAADPKETAKISGAR